METPLSELKAKARETVRVSAQAGVADDRERAPATDDAGDGFLRVIVSLRPGADVSDHDLETLLEAIEGALQPLDSRHASVRFLDAA